MEPILSDEIKLFISEKIDEVTKFNCNNCIYDCDECGILDIMHNLKVVLGIEKEEDAE
jgi:hypothetical protein